MFLLKVSDTGHGIKDEVRQHIFEPFFTTKGLAQGTGLGLSTVFGIVKIHGGHITYESKVGKGTIFDIYFPIAHAELCETDESKGLVTVAGGTETILLADDEDLIRDLAKRILENAGYRSLRARMGRRSWRSTRENRHTFPWSFSI